MIPCRCASSPSDLFAVLMARLTQEPALIASFTLFSPRPSHHNRVRHLGATAKHYQLSKRERAKSHQAIHPSPPNLLVLRQRVGRVVELLALAAFHEFHRTITILIDCITLPFIPPLMIWYVARCSSYSRALILPGYWLGVENYCLYNVIRGWFRV